MNLSADPSTGNGVDAAGEGSESKIDFRSYWRTIRKRWPFVVLSVIISTVIAFVYTYRQPKIFEATCQIIIEPMAPQVLPGAKDVVELGVKVLHQWFVLGPHDFVNVVEAPDASAIAKVSVALGARGSVHTQSYEMLEVEDLLNLLAE